MKPRLLDLFACEGGASVGYARAGFEVLAVDLDANRLRRNPHAWLIADAFAVIERYAQEFDAIHASPPCQGYTRGNAGKETSWPKLIPAVREALEATGLPYVIENVKDAGPEMVDPVGLCGCMFGLSTVDTDGVTIHLQRLRLFETNWGLAAPQACDHSEHEWVAGAYGGARRDKYEAKFVRKGGYVPPDKNVVKALLGIEHDMTWNGLYESLPPMYTQHIGYQLSAQIAGGRRMTDLLAALATTYGIDVADLPDTPPWNDHLEAEMERVANSVDPETGLPDYRPRRTR